MIVADLHIHGRFSRATSKALDVQNLEKYAKIKGVGLLGTGDFTHPQWYEELKNNLKEEDGILKTKTGFPFILQTEISLIYTQDGKGRRVHLVILAPSFDVVDQITEYLKKRGRVDYDGRPIFKIPCVNFVEDLKKISEDIEIIPAHCLIGDSMIHVNNTIKKIRDIKKGDFVYTHNCKWRKVQEVLSRTYHGKIYHIRPWYFTEGIFTTPEHPFYGIKSYKCKWIKGLCKKSCSKLNECKNKRFGKYLSEWIPASELKKGDFLIYPRFNKINDKKRFYKLKLNKDLCRLVGYYLAEGYTIREEGIGFSFNKNEDKYIQDVINLIEKIFGKKKFKFDERKGKDIIFYSKNLNKFFSNFYNSNIKKAFSKSLPSFFLELPFYKQKEIFKGWYFGDKGYTVSRELMNQMKIISLRGGIIPNISLDTIEKYKKRGKHFINGRKLKANYNLYSFHNLSFFEDKWDLLKEKEFRRFKTKMSRRHGWMDKNYIYIPIRKIEIENYQGEVYNLEVEEDNSYVSEFVCIHNCWTPWFSVFGSKSGFDSLKDCFGDQLKHIHALETGLSSDPEMNWRLSGLDKYELVSFSDLHSFWPWRIGRECTIFDIDLSYKNLIKALREKKVKETIEVDPGYGKYHFDGHRNCGVEFEPKESKKHNNICPKCNKPLTLGVLYRVEELADRPEGFKLKDAHPFKRLIPLSEIISAVLSKGIATKFVWGEYNKLINEFKNEFNILLNVGFDDLKKITKEKIAELIIKNREGKIKIKPGYDGVYGVPILDGEKQVSLGKY